MLRTILTAALLLFASVLGASAQNVMCATQVCAAPVHYLSAATTNATSVKAAPGAVYNLVAINTTATVYYLKLYDKAVAPTCNTDVVLQTFPVPPTPASGSPAPLMLTSNVGIGFNNGIGFCLTAAIADNDNTAAATGVAINFNYR